MFKFSVGDRVVIKRRLSTRHPYAMENNTSHPGYCATHWFHLPFCGMTVTISACYSEEDGQPGWYAIAECPVAGWTDGMFCKRKVREKHEPVAHVEDSSRCKSKMQ